MQKRAVLFARHAIPVLVTFVLVLGVFTGAQAGVDFKGKAIVFLVPSSPGGGTDIFGRFVASNIKRHLPGKPNIVVRNMPAGERPAQETDSRSVHRAQRARFPCAAFAEEMEPIDLSGQTGKHIEVVVTRNREHRNACVDELLHTILEI